MALNVVIRKFFAALIFAAVLAGLPAVAQTEDAEGCKDHPLFNRMPAFHIAGCENTQFELKRFPVGPAPSESAEDRRPKSAEVEGRFYFIRYELNEGALKPSPRQTMRNFQNAAKKAGATIEGEYPDWCKAELDETLHSGNGCILFGTTLKFGQQGKETWAFVESDGEGEGYEVWLVEREAMKQDITVNELREKLDKDGFITLYINFGTGSAAIQEDSLPQIDQVAEMLKSSSDLKLEVGGHTDNTGTADGNQKLSEARAKSVAAAIAARGIGAERLTAKGFGQSSPVADNRSEDGRAKNRRVELVKR